MASSPVDPATDTGTADRVLPALTPARRRLILAYFEDSMEQTATLDVLTGYVARQEEIESTTQERARVLLHHADLPKLADAGLIDYDARTRTVRYWGAPAGVEAAEWAHYLTQEGMTEWNR